MKKYFIITLAFISLSLSGQEQKIINTGEFTGVRCQGAATWELIPSNECKLIIKSDNPDVYKYIHAEVQGNILVINTTEKNKRVSKLFNSVEFLIMFKEIDVIALEGAGKIISIDTIKSELITASLKGSGKLDLLIDCKSFESEIKGTSMFKVKGKANHTIIDVGGVGGFSGLEFVSESVNVKVDGVGSAYVHATEELTAVLNGVGSIKYLGSPSQKDIKVSGVGTVKPYN